MSDNPEPPPPPPHADRKPWWEHSGFRSLVVILYGLWLPFLHDYLRGILGLAMAITVEASITAICGFFGINLVTQQAEARGRQQERDSQ